MRPNVTFVRGSAAMVASAVLAVVTAMALATPAAATAPGRDGRIAYSGDDGTGHFQLFTVRPDGTGRRQLTHVSGDQNAVFPDWAPNGRRLALTIQTGELSQLYTIRADGTGLHKIFSDRTHSYDQPRWSPDGRRLAYTTSLPGGVCDFNVSNGNATCALGVMDADGTHRHVLRSSRLWNYFDPEWSPDGTRIAYDTTQGGLISAIWLMNANGANPHRITPAKVIGTWPTWSPDGSEIAFTGGNDFGRPLYKIHPDGTGLRTILPAAQAPSHDFPSWSPAGDRIAYVVFRAEDDFDLVTVRPDGSAVRTVLTGVNGVLFIDFGPAGS